MRLCPALLFFDDDLSKFIKITPASIRKIKYISATKIKLKKNPRNPNKYIFIYEGYMKPCRN